MSTASVKGWPYVIMNQLYLKFNVQIPLLASFNVSGENSVFNQEKESCTNGGRFFFSLKVYGILFLTNRSHPIFFGREEKEHVCFQSYTD